jgi:hypothetical protein
MMLSPSVLARAGVSVLVVPVFPLHRGFEAPSSRPFRDEIKGIRRRASAPAGSKVVRISGLQARPLRGGTSISTQRVHNVPLRLASRRVLPRLLPPVDRQVEQPIAVIHHLDAARRRPVSLEDLGPVSQVARRASYLPGVLSRGCRTSPGGRIPRHLPAHEGAVPGALFVGALAKQTKVTSRE